MHVKKRLPVRRDRSSAFDGDYVPLIRAGRGAPVATTAAWLAEGKGAPSKAMELSGGGPAAVQRLSPPERGRSARRQWSQHGLSQRRPAGGQCK